jgi:hypothetical protein
LTILPRHAIVTHYIALLPYMLAGRVSFCVGVIQEILPFGTIDLATIVGATKKLA